MSHSPTPLKVQTTMDFPDAVRQIIDGKKITKLEWGDPQFFGKLRGSILMLHKPDGKYYHWIINDGDLLGTDWVVI